MAFIIRVQQTNYKKEIETMKKIISKFFKNSGASKNNYYVTNAQEAWQDYETKMQTALAYTQFPR